jgi:hypothetical protein
MAPDKSTTPEREATEQGVGAAPAPQAPSAPVIAVAPSRERTVLGVGAQAPAPAPTPAPTAPAARAPQRSDPEPPEDGWEPPNEEAAASTPEDPGAIERSMPIGLVTAKARVEAAVPSEPPRDAAKAPRKRARRWPVLLLLLLAAGAGAYVFRARLPWVNVVVERAATWLHH